MLVNRLQQKLRTIAHIVQRRDAERGRPVPPMRARRSLHVCVTREEQTVMVMGLAAMSVGGVCLGGNAPYVRRYSRTRQQQERRLAR